MRKTILTIMIGALSLSLCACGNKGNPSETQISQHTEENRETETETGAEPILPDLGQIRSICNLATMECYYHNVAKSVKEKGSGISHWGEKDRIFWIEYTGIAKIGINMAEVAMEINGENVTVVLPQATLISCGIEEIDESSFVYSQDSSWNKNQVSAEDQTAAVNQAQEDMKANVENDTALLASARDRAKKLIENYIEKLGEVSGVEYTITWELAK